MTKSILKRAEERHETGTRRNGSPSKSAAAPYPPHLRGDADERDYSETRAESIAVDPVPAPATTRRRRQTHDNNDTAKGNNADAAQVNVRRPSQADLLVTLALAAKAELFHTAGGNDAESFATVTVGGHRETMPVSGRAFRLWLGKLYYEEAGRTPNAQALQDAINVLAGRAKFDGPEYPVAVRLAEHDGAIYLDLADDGWRAVRVDGGGWTVITDCPVRFVRIRGMLALPVPVAGGSVDELRPLVNLLDDADWRLVVAWLLAALRPGFPFPLLAVNGEQGSAKSTLCRLLRALVDPNLAPLRRAPRDERDLMIAANNSWVVAFDNLSGIRPDLADALCSLATGGGFSTRELYTDDGEKLIDAMRPILLNGIEDIVTRPDLLDRAITVTLPAIDDARRVEEGELYPEFEASRPRILGALLTAVSVGLKNMPGVRLASRPRMADFARWVVAAEAALGWSPGSFLTAYEANRKGSNALALEASPVGPLLVKVADDGPWTGTVKTLLVALEAMADDALRRSRDWPATPRKLGGELRRLAPPLRRAGVNVVFGDRTSAGIPVAVERAGRTPTRSTRTTPPPSGAGETTPNGEPTRRTRPTPAVAEKRPVAEDS